MPWMRVETFEGTRQASRIFHGGDGYYYHLTNNRPQVTFCYLRCVKGDRGLRSCKGTAKATSNLQYLSHMHDHCHAPDMHYRDELQLRRDIKAAVQNGDPSPFREIIHNVGEGYNLEVRMRLPQARLNSSLNRIRSLIRPAVPLDLGVLGDALLQAEYRHLTKSKLVDENMFAGICGTMADGTFAIVFLSPTMREAMESRSRIFCDGTMRKLCRQPQCCQVYSIYGMWRHHGIPLFRALMLRKSEEAYDTLLDYIKILVPEFHPTTIMCDHERAQSNSWQKKFPEADVEGCLYHFAVAIWRQAKVIGLHDLMEQEEVVCSIVRSACALPMLPADELEDGLEDLGWEAFNSGWMPQLKDFFRYIEREWIPSRNETLSVFQATDRTNNVSESGNRSYNKIVKVSRPSIFTMLDAMVKLHDQGVLDLMSLQNGYQVTRSRKISALRNDLRIRRFSSDLLNGDITRLQFLHRASRRMECVFQSVFQF